MIIRHDDFDFRLETQKYIDIHEKFIAKGLTETAIIQITQNGKLHDFAKKRDLIEYMRTAPNWDIQFHCWEHKHYSTLPYHEVVKELSAGLLWMGKLFGKLPTVWYPSYNDVSPEMHMAVKLFDMTIDNEVNGIEEFVKSNGKARPEAHSVHFHGWTMHEMTYFDKMLDLVIERQNESR